MIKEVRKVVAEILSKNKFPIALGGEHSITPGVIQAFTKDIAVLSVDAHFDFRQEYENEIYNHACSLRRIADYVGIKNIAEIGIRSAEKEEFEVAKKLGLFYIDAFEIKKIGINKALDKTKDYLGKKQVYFSLDIDVLDPAYAPGTSTPEPFGLTPFDVIKCIETFSSNLIGFDIVEVCPPYDKGQTALLAAKYVRYVIEQVESRN
jgi:agmatinase